MSDGPALVHFYQGWEDTHELSSDGLPVFRSTTMIQIERPPTLNLHRPASPQEFVDYPDEYEVFKNEIRGRDPAVAETGYPLVMWPALAGFQVQMLTARGIHTVEELAKLAGRRDLPGNLGEVALRAERLMDMQKQFGKYEALLKERDAQLVELNAQVNDLKQTVSAQNSMIDTLKMRVA
jgi:hypothetical protein